ncbi:DUF7253 family protein [Intestinibacter sp.]|uniref:DUF7253 family protein n=1 Tax=Intestinibacter sp. TaxID=1965304 RepID=UPI002A7478A1|nr:hypothetical protein [Intestinibacter sp.]MDY2736308.1 hypothetical protein [Intestinibacter sp.]
MAKFYGTVGFVKTVESAPGVWTEQIVERKYYGNVISRTRSLQSNGVNDNINISDEISIVADPFANENYFAIRFIEYMGAKWKVQSISVQFPRLNLSLGGLYNE